MSAETIAVPRDLLSRMADALSTEAAGHMTCYEAEAVEAVLLLLSADDAAAFIQCHSQGDDDPEDQHYRGDDE